MDIALSGLTSELRQCSNLQAGSEILKESARVSDLARNAVVEDYSSNRLVADAYDQTLAELFGWPDDVIQSWVERQMTFVSPVGAICRMVKRPFVCRYAKPSLPISLHLNAGQRRVLEFLSNKGFAGCIVTPVHQPLGRVGAVLWLSEDPKLDLERLLGQHEQAFFLLGHYFFDLLTYEQPHSARAAAASWLSEREIECLTWVALGKTDKEVAVIIERSATTVRFHLDNAARKLNATRRTQAVAKAAQLGVIRPVW